MPAICNLLGILFYFCISFQIILSEDLPDVSDQFEELYTHKYSIYHRLSHHSNYSKRGNLLVVPSRSVAKYLPDEGEISAFVDAEKNSLNKGQDLNETIYHVQIIDDENQKQTFVSFTKWCLLQSSNFEDEIIVHLNHENKLFHFDYYTAQSRCNQNSPETASFKTSVQTIKAVKGVVPKLAKAAPIRPDGTVEPPHEEKTFLQKYWIYIVPLLLILMFGGGPAEEGQGQGGGQGGQGTRPAPRQ
ncbi:hypothetical protein G9A89_017324 [Geosiphon pyriformis]|nr:hypothetical protein G9A89_017324 [Geosiphon pyriformis]